jgi:hypothetical protein
MLVDFAEEVKRLEARGLLPPKATEGSLYDYNSASRAPDSMSVD